MDCSDVANENVANENVTNENVANENVANEVIKSGPKVGLGPKLGFVKV